MNAQSTDTQDVADSGRDASRGVRAPGETNDTAGNIQSDLQALRDDFGRLAEQVTGLLAQTGNAAWRHARVHVDGVVADAQDKGREAVGAVREVSDRFADAVDRSIKQRPYATLALTAGLGFLLGAIWRR
jgi:ElaB/YqjD/DUF883 family membrane-anchored ribosome-binding protein